MDRNPLTPSFCALTDVFWATCTNPTKWCLLGSWPSNGVFKNPFQTLTQTLLLQHEGTGSAGGWSRFYNMRGMFCSPKDTPEGIHPSAYIFLYMHLTIYVGSLCRWLDLVKFKIIAPKISWAIEIPFVLHLKIYFQRYSAPNKLMELLKSIPKLLAVCPRKSMYCICPAFILFFLQFLKTQSLSHSPADFHCLLNILLLLLQQCHPTIFLYFHV